MKVVNAVTIGKLIEAYYDGNEDNFNSYANFIADAYEEQGDLRSANIIRNKISGNYKNKSKSIVVLDEVVCHENKAKRFC